MTSLSSPFDQPRLSDPQDAMTVATLLDRAKAAIESGGNALRVAAEDIATAKAKGATQRVIAMQIGKSEAWVSQILHWRKNGYLGGTAFGPQAKASRERARILQSPERADANHRPPETDVVSDAQKVSNGRPAQEDVENPEINAQATAYWEMFARNAQKHASDRRSRDRLVKILGMLGSEHPGERDAAALTAETLRAKLGLSWDRLIVHLIHRPARDIIPPLGGARVFSYRN